MGKGAFTACYSYRYRQCESLEESELFKELDFVIVHPQMGYLVVEVKQGMISYRNGSWYEYNKVLAPTFKVLKSGDW